MAEDRRLGSRLYLDPATLIISSQKAREHVHQPVKRIKEVKERRRAKH
jgi:hypothetical protein